MRPQSLGALLLMALRSSAAARRLDSQAEGEDDRPKLETTEEDARIVPGRYIVEFAPTARHQGPSKILESHRGLNVRKYFRNPDIFFGASVDASEDGDALSTLMGEPSIARVWPVKSVKLITNVYQQNFSEIVDAIDYNIHGRTGVEAMHKAGILGEGATVAVVDTGIDYTHPGIGGGYGPGYTVRGGTDLVGDGCWPNKGCPLEPDDDPMDYHGHGTHVAGIITGRSKWFTGVAPKAKLLAYKVFTEAGWVLEDVLIEAFIDAYENEADVIAASIGAISGWQDSPWAIVSDRLVENGVVVTIAAGNDGNMGPFMFSDGAAGRNVLGIAATEPEYVPQPALEVSFTYNGTTNRTRMGHFPKRNSPWPSSLKDVPVVHVGSACTLPEGIDLTNKIALIERWFCSPMEKERNILKAGGEYILLFDPVEPDRDGVYIGDWMEIVFAALAEDDGQALAAALEEGCRISLTVPSSETIVGMENPMAGTPSYFSSFGATFDHAVKPDIGAPGSGILSLYLDHGFAAMDGTSMATPYVAGVAALYIGSHIAWANHLGMPMPGDIAASVAQTGTGLVNATKVVLSGTQLSFTKFALNDTHRFSRYQGLEITNNNPEPVTYTFDVAPAGAFEAYTWNSDGHPQIRNRKSMINDVMNITPEVKIPTGTHRLAPGQTKKVQFAFKIPEGMNYKNMPVYSGKVIVKASNGEDLSVPYLGVGGNTGKEVRNQIWYRAIGFPKVYSNYDDSIKDKNKFTFNTSVAEQDFPKLQAVVNYGSPELRWDIFEADWREHEWKYPPVPGKDGHIGSVAAWAGSTSELGAVFDPEFDSVDDVVPFPRKRLTRNVVYNAWWLGRLSNGSDIAPGKYNMRIAVLAPFGNPQASDNWDRFPTPMIEVLPE